VITNTPEEFRELVRAEYENTGKLVKARPQGGLSLGRPKVHFK